MSTNAIPIPQGAMIDDAPSPQSTPQSAPQAQPMPIPSGASVDAAPNASPNALPSDTATISAVHEPKTWVGKFGQWAEDVAADLEDGGDRTGVGTVLAKLGARGLHAGNSEAVGDFMGSLPLGLLQATKGGTQLVPHVLGGPQGQTVKGLANVVRGGIKAMTMPAAFVAPEASPLSEEGVLNDAAAAAANVTNKAAAPVSKAASAVAGKVGDTASGLANLATNIPKEAEGKLVDAIGEAAENAGFERGDASTLKDAVSDLADKFKGRAQDAYQRLDDEAPGFQELRDKIGQLKNAYKVQLNLDPSKADEIAGTLKDAQSNMADLLDEGQNARWKAADQDWTRYKALQKVQGKANAAADDLTSDALQSVDKLHAGVRALSNSSKGGNPIDVLARAFGDDAGNIRQIVQDASDLKSNTQAAKLLLKWAAPIAGAGYAVTKGGNALADALSGGH